ncbi:MAG: hypothetical protein A3F43_03495 [Gammaproteobacteria bacterium RIFCSPHIGHO2_12_FULL_42_10]|nr:MAG: hypothetical protein A3F43_03495 [Gammaproteobacteria bacterium RIFCSPHIGHO2_12_FULL_42_10]
MQHALIKALSQQVIQQEVAMTLLGSALFQNIPSRLQNKHSPRGRFLFVGPGFSGRKTAASALAEQLFEQQAAYYIARSLPHYVHLTDIKLQCQVSQQYYSMQSAIQKTPHAIFLFDEIENLSPTLLHEFSAILSTGFFFDEQCMTYDFRRAIMIFTTSIGAAHLASFGGSNIPREDSDATYLTKLLMQAQKITEDNTSLDIANQITEKMMPDILKVFPSCFCREVDVIPFFSLDQDAISKVIRKKLTYLDEMLRAQYEVTLSFAPMVVRFLSQQMAIKHVFDYQYTHPERIFSQIYTAIEQALLTKPPKENAEKPQQLFLQIQEGGRGLQCDWLVIAVS